MKLFLKLFRIVIVVSVWAVIGKVIYSVYQKRSV